MLDMRERLPILSTKVEDEQTATNKGGHQMNSKGAAITLNVLLREEEGYCVAHCLELDIVATGSTVNEVKKNIRDLINAQIDYAFSNNNLENLFRPAPKELWEMVYACKNPLEEKFRLKSKIQEKRAHKTFVPPWIISKICHTGNACPHVK